MNIPEAKEGESLFILLLRDMLLSNVSFANLDKFRSMCTSGGSLGKLKKSLYINTQQFGLALFEMCRCEK